MSTSATPGPVPEASSESTAALSEGQRLINVFIAPEKTFSDLTRKGNWSWIAPLVLLSVVSYAFLGAVVQKVGFRQLTENTMRTRPKMQERMAEMSAEQRERMLEVSSTVTKVVSFFIPALILVISLIIAAVLVGTFTFGLGAEISFGRSVAIVLYAQLPAVVKSLLAVVALYAGADPEGFSLENPIACNLGYFVDISSHPAWYALASAVDIFAVWVIVLIGIGFACFSKVKKTTAILVVFAWYVLYILIFKVGPAALFG